MTPVFSLSLQLLPLLLEALSCSDRVVQLSTLSCLHPLLLEAPQVMSLHVNTLVTKFLDLTSSPTMVRASPPSSLLCPFLLPFVLPSPLSVPGCPHRRSALCPRPHQSAHNSGKCFCSPLLPAPACRGAKGSQTLWGEASIHFSHQEPLLSYSCSHTRAELSGHWPSLWTTKRGWCGRKQWQHVENGECVELAAEGVPACRGHG